MIVPAIASPPSRRSPNPALSSRAMCRCPTRIPIATEDRAGVTIRPAAEPSCGRGIEREAIFSDGFPTLLSDRPIWERIPRTRPARSP